ncbi:MAG: trp operon repressor [Parachlamydiaceae bacterium]|nr:trp operon repressor [Parachlamydiaceae bacterium]
MITSKKSTKESWRSFLELCSKIHTPDELGRFFDLFLTHEEKETMSSRYLIIKSLIEDQVTQREISRQYHVSIAQITRGSNALKIIDPKLKKLLKTLFEKNQFESPED